MSGPFPYQGGYYSGDTQASMADSFTAKQPAAFYPVAQDTSSSYQPMSEQNEGSHFNMNYTSGGATGTSFAGYGQTAQGNWMSYQNSAMPYYNENYTGGGPAWLEQYGQFGQSQQDEYGGYSSLSYGYSSGKPSDAAYKPNAPMQEGWYGVSGTNNQNSTPRPPIHNQNSAPRPTMNKQNSTPRPPMNYQNSAPRPPMNNQKPAPRPPMNNQKSTPRPPMMPSQYRPTGKANNNYGSTEYFYQAEDKSTGYLLENKNSAGKTYMDRSSVRPHGFSGDANRQPFNRSGQQPGQRFPPPNRQPFNQYAPDRHPSSNSEELSNERYAPQSRPSFKNPTESPSETFASQGRPPFKKPTASSNERFAAPGRQPFKHSADASNERSGPQGRQTFKNSAESPSERFSSLNDQLFNQPGLWRGHDPTWKPPVKKSGILKSALKKGPKLTKKQQQRDERIKLRVWKNPVVTKNREKLKEDIVKYLSQMPQQKQRKKIFWKCLFKFTKSNNEPQYYGCNNFKYLFDLLLDVLIKYGGYYKLRSAPVDESDRVGGYGSNKGIEIYEDGTFYKRVLEVLKKLKGSATINEFAAVYTKEYGDAPRHPRNWAEFPQGVSICEDVFYLKDVALPKAKDKFETGPAFVANRASLKKDIIRFLSKRPQHRCLYSSFWEMLFKFTGRQRMKHEFGVSKLSLLFKAYKDVLFVDEQQQYVTLLDQEEQSGAQCKGTGDTFKQNAITVLQSFGGSCPYQQFIDSYLKNYGKSASGPNSSGLVVGSLVNLKKFGVVDIHDDVIWLGVDYQRTEDQKGLWADDGSSSESEEEDVHEVVPGEDGRCEDFKVAEQGTLREDAKYKNFKMEVPCDSQDGANYTECIDEKNALRPDNPTDAVITEEKFHSAHDLQNPANDHQMPANDAQCPENDAQYPANDEDNSANNVIPRKDEDRKSGNRITGLRGTAEWEKKIQDSGRGDDKIERNREYLKQEIINYLSLCENQKSEQDQFWNEIILFSGITYSAKEMGLPILKDFLCTIKDVVAIQGPFIQLLPAHHREPVGNSFKKRMAAILNAKGGKCKFHDFVKAYNVVYNKKLPRKPDVVKLRNNIVRLYDDLVSIDGTTIRLRPQLDAKEERRQRKEARELYSKEMESYREGLLREREDRPRPDAESNLRRERPRSREASRDVRSGPRRDSRRRDEIDRRERLDRRHAEVPSERRRSPPRRDPRNRGPSAERRPGETELQREQRLLREMKEDLEREKREVELLKREARMAEYRERDRDELSPTLPQRIQEHYGSEAIQSFRTLERASKRLANWRSHLLFNESCLENKVNPRSINSLEINVSNRTQRLIEKRIRECKSEIDKSEKEIAAVEKSLSRKIPPDALIEIQDWIANVEQKGFHAAKERQSVKLHRLMHKKGVAERKNREKELPARDERRRPLKRSMSPNERRIKRRRALLDEQRFEDERERGEDVFRQGEELFRQGMSTLYRDDWPPLEEDSRLERNEFRDDFDQEYSYDEGPDNWNNPMMVMLPPGAFTIPQDGMMGLQYDDMMALPQDAMMGQPVFLTPQDMPVMMADDYGYEEEEEF